ncbi:hypothetical protein, partial [Mesorhizobium metallidurans]
IAAGCQAISAGCEDPRQIAEACTLLTDCCQQGCAMMLSSKQRRLVMNGFTILRSVQHYVGKIRTMRNEIRTQRFMNELPADLRKDIGWPDMYASGRRNDN